MCTLKIVMINVKHKISKNEMISTNVQFLRKKLRRGLQLSATPHHFSGPIEGNCTIKIVGN